MQNGWVGQEKKSLNELFGDNKCMMPLRKILYPLSFLASFFAVSYAFAFMADTSNPTFSEIARKVARPSGAPIYSDVCFSSRSRRPEDILKDAAAFHATRLDWMSSVNPAWIKECKRRGYHFQGWLSSILPDFPGTQTRKMGRIKNAEGQMIAAPWMRKQDSFWWGCVNSPEFRTTFIEHAKRNIDGGADVFQVDDPVMNLGAVAWGGCFCEYCKSKASTLGIDLHTDMKKFQEESVRGFYSYVREQIDSYAGRHIPFSSNNYGGAWVFSYNLFEFGVAELPKDKIAPAEIYGKFQAARRLGKAQVFVLRSEQVKLSRAAIAAAYAVGGHVIVPWDVHIGKTEKDENIRYYGRPEEYADIYGFIRGMREYIDDFEEAAVAGNMLPKSRHNNDIRLVELHGGSGNVGASVRARPGQANGPIVIHLIEWAEAPRPFEVKLYKARAFGNKPFSVKLLMPREYETGLHDRAEESKDFSMLVRESDVLVNSSDEWINIKVPALKPWGILVLAVSSETGE